MVEMGLYQAARAGLLVGGRVSAVVIAWACMLQAERKCSRCSDVLPYGPAWVLVLLIVDLFILGMVRKSPVEPVWLHVWLEEQHAIRGRADL